MIRPNFDGFENTPVWNVFTIHSEQPKYTKQMQEKWLNEFSHSFEVFF